MTTKTPEELLKDLDSKNASVREAAAKNPNATPEVLLKALEDENSDVRKSAQESLQNDPILQLQVAVLEAQKVAS